jgi:excisionase family DNA binding protein
MNRKLMTIREAAKALGRSVFFIRDEIARKRLPHHRLGYRIYVSEANLDEYLARTHVPANSGTQEVSA